MCFGKKVVICCVWVLVKLSGLGDEVCMGRIKYMLSVRVVVWWCNVENIVSF